MNRQNDPLVCPCCGGVQRPGAGVNDGTAGGFDDWVHKEIERTFLTDEEAIAIFKKYGKKQYMKSYGYNAGSKLFEHAWEMQQWMYGPSSYGNHYKRLDWVGDDLILAFDWYLDCVGRNLGDGIGRAEGTKTREEIKSIEKEITDYIDDLREKKRESQWNSYQKKQKKMEDRGEEFMKNMKVGDVYLVQWKGHWNIRPIQVLEIEDGYFAGFYLDPVDTEVPADAPEKPGYRYTKPRKEWSEEARKYLPTGPKREWDGVSCTKTRSYVEKDAKFIKEKLDKIEIKK